MWIFSLSWMLRSFKFCFSIEFKRAVMLYSYIFAFIFDHDLSNSLSCCRSKILSLTWSILRFSTKDVVWPIKCYIYFIISIWSSTSSLNLISYFKIGFLFSSTIYVVLEYILIFTELFELVYNCPFVLCVWHFISFIFAGSNYCGISNFLER